MKKLALLILFLSLGLGLTAQKSKDQKKSETLDELVTSKQFQIESQWARPQGGTTINSLAASNLQPPGSSGNRINLIGNYNFLQMDGETISVILPYFGERQVGGDHYSGNTGIEFEGTPRNLVIERNEKKKSYEISFDIDKGTETFQVNIELFKNMKSNITINSNQRFVIRYDGKVMALKEKEEEGK